MDKVTVGLVLLALGIWGAVSWWWFLIDIIKGGIVIVLFLAGLMLVGMGVRSSLNLGTDPQQKTSKSKA